MKPSHPRRHPLRAMAEHAPDALFLAGAVALLRGLAELSPPLAYVAAGLGMLWLGIRLAKPPTLPTRRREPSR